MSAKARVRLEAVGAENVRQALTGIDRQVDQSTRRRVQAVNRLEREEKESLDTVAREHKTNARERERVDRDGHRRRVQYLRDETREAKRSARETAREQRITQRRARAGVVGGAILGGVSSGVQSAFGRIQSYGGALGQLSREELVATSFRLRGNAARLAARRGDGMTTEGLLGRVNSVAQQTGVPQEDLLGGLSEAQGRFSSNFEFFEENLARLAEVARASGQPLEVIIGAIGKLADADPSLSADDLLESINLLTSLGSEGKVEFGELATSFGQLLGVFQRGSGMHGTELVQNFGMLASMMAAGGTTDRQSATRLERMVAELNDPRAITRMNGLLGRGRNAGSPVHINGDIEQGIDMPAFMELLQNPALQTQAAGRGIFRSIEAQQGFGTLQTAAGDESLMSGLRGASSEAGANEIAAINASLDAGNMHAASRIGINQLASFDAAGGTEQEFVTNMISAASTISEYEAAHLGVIEVLGGLKKVVVGIGGAAIGMKMLGIGGGTAAAGGAAAVGGLGAAAILPVAGAGMGLGALGDFLTERLTGMSATQRVDAARNGEEQVYSPLVHDLNEMFFGGEGDGGRVGAGRGGSAERPAPLQIHPDSVAAIGNATAGAVNTQSRRQEGGAARRGGS